MAAPLLLLLFLAFSSRVECADEEKLALVAFSRDIVFDPNGALSQWNEMDRSPCNWPGVSCFDDGRVSSLELENLGLEGSIARELAILRSIVNLNLRGNNFLGQIPVEFGSLVHLENLDLSSNRLSGEIPSELYKLPKIKQLHLSNNDFSGELAGKAKSNHCGFCNMLTLEKLDISNNVLKGRLPSCILRVPSVRFENNCLDLVPGQKVCGGESLRRELRQHKNGKNSSRTKHEHHSRSARHHHHKHPVEVTDAGGVQLLEDHEKSVPVPVQATTVNHESPPVKHEPPPAAPVTVVSQKPPPSPPMVRHKPPPSPKPKRHPPPVVHQIPKKHHHKDHHRRKILSAVLPIGGALFLVTGIASFLVYKRRTAAVSPWKTGMSGHLQKTLAPDVPALRWTELQAACEDFSNIIGSSPDCVVFKGTLTNMVEVAVTSIRISAASWTASSEIFFRRKVEALSRMKHTHLVNLIGYCAEEEPFARMLLFEYVPNGTLFEHLHNEDVEHLDWQARMRVVMGAAYGLEYMHHDLLPPASHSCFDSSAIYLTEDYAAKVADYGTSKLAVIKSDRRKSISNAFGYDDLEGSDRLAPDFESNIFSFGLFLLEVVTGRLLYTEKEGSLLDWAMVFLDFPEVASRMVDPTLKNVDLDQLMSVCDVVRLCINTDASKRPTMKHITALLAKDLNMSPAKAQPKCSPLQWAELEILSTDID